MQYKGMNLCDYCFEQIPEGSACPKCGITKDTYSVAVGLLPSGTNLLGKYIIGRVLGRGGFGATYLAYSSEKERRVAIKEYFPTGMAYRGQGEEKVALISADKRDVFQKGAKRFFDEAKTMSRFNNNRNVVSVYEFFYANDTVYYSMEYLEGIDLKGYVEKRGGKISEGEAITIMMSVAEALVAIHSTGTLHRDISPDNIFICTDGTVKLIDFGAAKQVVGEQSQSLSVILKQGFAPVEQYQKGGKQGMWTDIYAVGASIYYALTGKVPEDAMSRMENPNITFPAELNISDKFTNIINNCMKIKMAERYQSAIELQDALGEVAYEAAPIGGNDFVQTVYRSASAGSSGLNGGGSVQLGSQQQSYSQSQQSAYPQSGYNPYNNVNTTYPNSANIANQTHYSPSQVYPMSQYPQSGYIPPQNDKKSGMTKGIIIGGSVLAVAIIVIIVLVKVLSPVPNQQPIIPPPPPMGQPMPGGPMGQPMPGGPMGQPMPGQQMPQTGGQ